jgi:hypothetical protein
MEFKRIVAVTGMPGLYEVLSSKADGAIVRSLDDKSTKFVSSRVHNLSHLESIEIYTQRDNVSLTDVFNAMKDSSEKMPDVKDNKALKSYFEKVYPDMDFERVYTSDMKKMVKWFEVLQANEVDFNVVAEEAPEEEAVEVASETEAPAKKSKAKATKTTEEETSAEPKVKAAAKTKSEAKPKAKATEKESADEEKPKRTRKKKTEE